MLAPVLMPLLKAIYVGDQSIFVQQADYDYISKYIHEYDAWFFDCVYPEILSDSESRSVMEIDDLPMPDSFKTYLYEIISNMVLFIMSVLPPSDNYHLSRFSDCVDDPYHVIRSYLPNFPLPNAYDLIDMMEECKRLRWVHDFESSLVLASHKKFVSHIKEITPHLFYDLAEQQIRNRLLHVKQSYSMYKYAIRIHSESYLFEYINSVNPTNVSAYQRILKRWPGIVTLKCTLRNMDRCDLKQSIEFKIKQRTEIGKMIVMIACFTRIYGTKLFKHQRRLIAMLPNLVLWDLVADYL